MFALNHGKFQLILCLIPWIHSLPQVDITLDMPYEFFLIPKSIQIDLGSCQFLIIPFSLGNMHG